MSKARHPKPYNNAPRKQMTPAWKARVLSKLEENEAAGVRPGNLSEMASVLKSKDSKADKAGIYRTFKTPQMSSSYVDAICALLKIDPPMVENDDDDQDLKRDIAMIRAMPADARRALILVAEQMLKKR